MHIWISAVGFWILAIYGGLAAAMSTKDGFQPTEQATITIGVLIGLGGLLTVFWIIAMIRFFIRRRRIYRDSMGFLLLVNPATEEEARATLETVPSLWPSEIQGSTEMMWTAEAREPVEQRLMTAAICNLTSKRIPNLHILRRPLWLPNMVAPQMLVTLKRRTSSGCWVDASLGIKQEGTKIRIEIHSYGTGQYALSQCAISIVLSPFVTALLPLSLLSSAFGLVFGGQTLGYVKYQFLDSANNCAEFWNSTAEWNDEAASESQFLLQLLQATVDEIISAASADQSRQELINEAKSIKKPGDTQVNW